MEYYGRIKIIYLYQPGRPWVNGHRLKKERKKITHGITLPNRYQIGKSGNVKKSIFHEMKLIYALGLYLSLLSAS